MKYGFLILSLLVMVQSGQAQGFLNLDFEDATVSPTPINGFGGAVDPNSAFPGWTIGGGSNPSIGNSLFVLYNNLTLGSPAIDLIGPNFPNALGLTPLQGSYSVELQYFFGSVFSPPTLSQTGLVPTNAQSINFLVGDGASDAVVSVNGVNIPLVSIPGGRLAGDISDYAGSMAQLTFSTPSSRGNLYFDDVQFSSSSVPEPSSLALGALGALLLVFRRR